MAVISSGPRQQHPWLSVQEDPLPVELLHLVLAYCPGLGLGLAPTDRVAIVRGITGTTIPVERTRIVLQQLEYNDTPNDFLDMNLTDEEWIQALLSCSGSHVAFQELLRLNAFGDITRPLLDEQHEDSRLRDYLEEALVSARMDPGLLVQLEGGPNDPLCEERLYENFFQTACNPEFIAYIVRRRLNIDDPAYTNHKRPWWASHLTDPLDLLMADAVCYSANVRLVSVLGWSSHPLLDVLFKTYPEAPPRYLHCYLLMLLSGRLEDDAWLQSIYSEDIELICKLSKDFDCWPNDLRLTAEAGIVKNELRLTHSLHYTGKMAGPLHDGEIQVSLQRLLCAQCVRKYTSQDQQSPPQPPESDHRGYDDAPVAFTELLNGLTDLASVNSLTVAFPDWTASSVTDLTIARLLNTHRHPVRLFYLLPVDRIVTVIQTWPLFLLDCLLFSEFPLKQRLNLRKLLKTTRAAASIAAAAGEREEEEGVHGGE